MIKYVYYFIKRFSQIPKIVSNGYPGGCGIPSWWAEIIKSEESPGGSVRYPDLM